MNCVKCTLGSCVRRATLTCSLAFCVCSLVLFSCRDAVCLWRANICACRWLLWDSSCFSCVRRACFSAWRVAFWTNIGKVNYRYDLLIMMSCSCRTVLTFLSTSMSRSLTLRSSRVASWLSFSHLLTLWASSRPRAGELWAEHSSSWRWRRAS